MAEAKKPRRRRLLSNMAEEVGLSWGQFMVTRHKEDVDTVEAWLKDLKRGRKPDDLSHMKLKDAYSLANAEKEALIQRELDGMKYFHPQQRSVESKNEHHHTFDPEKLTDAELAVIAAGGGAGTSTEEDR